MPPITQSVAAPSVSWSLFDLISGHRARKTRAARITWSKARITRSVAAPSVHSGFLAGGWTRLRTLRAGIKTPCNPCYSSLWLAHAREHPAQQALTPFTTREPGVHGASRVKQGSVCSVVSSSNSVLKKAASLSTRTVPGSENPPSPAHNHFR